MGKGGGVTMAAAANHRSGKTNTSSCCVQVCELGEQLEQEKAHCEGLLRQDRRNVIQYFQKLEAVLARKKCACLDALDKAGVDVCLAYDPLIDRVKELQVGVKSFLSSVCVVLRRIWAELGCRCIT